MKLNSIALSFTLSLVSFLLVLPNAHAQTVIGDQITPSAIGSAPMQTTSQRRVTMVGSANEIYGKTLELRSADHRKHLAQLEASAKIDATQSATIKSDLDRIDADMSAAKTGNNLNSDKALSLAQQLDQVGTRLAAIDSSLVLQPLVIIDGGKPRISLSSRSEVITMNAGGSTTTTITTSTSATPQSWPGLLNSRRYEVEKLILQGVSNQTLTPDQAAELTAELNRIAAQIAAVTPVTSEMQMITMAHDLDLLADSVASKMRISALTPITVTTNGKMKMDVDSFGTIVQPNVGTEVFFTTLGSRREQLESMIAAGIASGTLNAAQSAELRAELAHLANLEAIAKSGGAVELVNVLPIAMELDVLGNRIITYTHGTSYLPLIAGTRFVLIGNRVILLDDIMVRRAELEGRIAREQATGRLTPEESVKLRADLDLIARRESQFRTDGKFGYDESRMLYRDFDKVGSRLDSYVAGRRATLSVK